MTDGVLLEVDGPVATLTLNRPQSLNALDPALASQLCAALGRLEQDPAVRCVVLRGAGGHFMAGGDVTYFHARLPEIRASLGADLEPLFEDVHGIIRTLRRMPQPVVASLEGAVAGFGLSLMAACDLAVAAEDCKFTLAYCHIGASPDGGSTFLLPRLVGMRHAAELALLGERFDAARALELGLVNRVVSAAALAGATRELAARLAAGPARAYARTKALLNSSFAEGLDAQLDRERDAFIACAQGEEFAEGVGAFCEKRKPRFA